MGNTISWTRREDVKTRRKLIHLHTQNLADLPPLMAPESLMPTLMHNMNNLISYSKLDGTKFCYT